ncbi:MAG: DNA primase [Planctomycetia bacterium]|nr:DNA primase [Planctomycetia bacterium]
MSFDWADAKLRVRQAVDIVELVGDYLPLRREGRGYKALCPWHDDTKPSLQVNAERQSFKCWVCDIGGDIFSFIMKMEGIDFPEAVQLLADKAGIKLEPKRSPDGSLAPVDDKRELLQALAWAEQRFQAYLLNDPEAEPARRYLAERGITDESIHHFHCGYSPNRWDWLVQEARKTAFSARTLIGAGLIGERTNGPGHYDRFRGRVLFSIRDPQGRPVGFGGRVLPGISDDSPAKYVNSPETALFQKSSLLYALDHAKEAITRTRTAVVMEGYTDVVIAHQCGFKNAVAVLGTALGERHVKLLKRFADRIVLVLDGDEAGRKRTDEILELFVAEQVDLRVLTLPDELDPADFLLQHGSAAMESLMGDAIDALDHKFYSVTAGLGSQPSTHQISQALESILGVLAKAPRLADSPDSAAKMREDQTLVRLSQLSGISEERIRQRLAAMRRTATKPRAYESRSNSDKPAVPEVESPFTPVPDEQLFDSPKYAQAERWLLEIAVHAPEHIAELKTLVAVEELRHPAHRVILAAAFRISEEGILPDFDRLMLEFDDARAKNFLIDLDEGRRIKARAATSQELSELVRVLQDQSLAFRRPRRTAIAESGSKDSIEREEELVARLKALHERERSRQGISAPMDG